MDTNDNVIRVVSAAVDTKQVVLYLDTGKQLVIKQGDGRLGDLFEKIIPINRNGEIAIISLNDFSVYAAFTQQNEGKTSFFRMVKSKVKGFFGGKTETHETHIPEEGKKAILMAVNNETMTEEEVIEHGLPVDLNDEIGPDEMIVAVVTTPAVPATETTPAVPAQKAVIPGVNNLRPHFEHAVRIKSVGLQRFLERCAKFIDKRNHSVDDLMRFLEKGDLPIADDGSIIAYKVLRKSGEEGIFLDCHSRKIKQRVGSYVCVDEALVDLNRRNECSNGLHIARRAYLKGFGGDVLVLCKIDPEDVMVVPHNDANKVRVKGYHILGVLSNKGWDLLANNTPLTGEEPDLLMVYQAIKGQHIDRIEEVKVHGQMGNDVRIRSLVHDASRAEGGYAYTQAELDKARALDDKENIRTATINPKDVNKRLKEDREKLAEAEPEIDIPALEKEMQEEPVVGTGVDGKGSTETVKNATASHVTADKDDPIVARNAKDAEHQKLAETATAPDKPRTKKDDMADLVLDFQTAPDASSKLKAASAITAMKKASKVSWERLGVAPSVVNEILNPTTAAKQEPKEKPVKVGPKVKSAGTPLLGSKAKPQTLAQEARQFFINENYDDLIKLGKSRKKSLRALGFSEPEIEKITAAK